MSEAITKAQGIENSKAPPALAPQGCSAMAWLDRVGHEGADLVGADSRGAVSRRSETVH